MNDTSKLKIGDKVLYEGQDMEVVENSGCYMPILMYLLGKNKGVKLVIAYPEKIKPVKLPKGVNHAIKREKTRDIRFSE